jgi:ribosomal protein S18 acetylase RimI-like enzyme
MTEIEAPIQHLRIRPFEFELDIHRVLDLWTHAGNGVRLSRSDQPHEIKKKLKQDPDLFLVAELGDVLIGAVLGGYDGRRGLVYHLAVSDGHRKQGIGKMLMQELEDRLRSKGCLKYYLLVTKGNKDALNFYKKIGCEVMGLYLLGKELT